MKAIVSEIRELRRGFRVTLDDQSEIRLTKKNHYMFGLKAGDAVETEELRQTLLQEQYPDALNRAVRLLALRARSIQEIERKLSDACFMDETIEMVITKLESNRLLDDAAFADQWVRERTARQIGKARILQELRQKGVDAEIAENAVAEMNEEAQQESAVRLAEKMQKRYQRFSEEEARRKTIQAMQRRGFSYGEAKEALEKLKE